MLALMSRKRDRMIFRATPGPWSSAITSIASMNTCAPLLSRRQRKSQRPGRVRYIQAETIACSTSFVSSSRPGTPKFTTVAPGCAKSSASCKAVTSTTGPGLHHQHWRRNELYAKGADRLRALRSDSRNRGRPEKTAESTMTTRGWCGTWVLSKTASMMEWSDMLRWMVDELDPVESG